jgi:hypothetical protein
VRARTGTRASAPDASAPLRARTGTRECPGPAPLRAWGTREPVPPAPLRVAPLRARTGTRECPGTQHKHCLPCICAAVCPQFDTSLLNITAGMVAGLSRPRRVGEGSTLDDFAVSALRRAAQPKTKRARTDGQEAHDVALARDGRLGEAAAAAVAVADGARTLSSGEREGRWSLSSGEREGRWRASRKSIWRTQSITHVTVILRIASFYTRGSHRIPVGWGRRMRGVQEEVAQVSCLCRGQDVSREKKSFSLTMGIPSAFLMGVSAICVRQRRQFRVRNDLVQCDVDTVRYSLFNFGVNKFISGVNNPLSMVLFILPWYEQTNTV